MLRQLFDDLASVHLPDLQRASNASGRDPPSIGRNGKVSDNIGVLLEGEYGLGCAGADVPYLDVGVLGRRGNQVGLLLVSNARDRCLVPREDVGLHLAQGPHID
jgi:hypothetical protein